jgi:hypothetical protein
MLLLTELKTEVADEIKFADAIGHGVLIMGLYALSINPSGKLYG